MRQVRSRRPGVFEWPWRRAGRAFGTVRIQFGDCIFRVADYTIIFFAVLEKIRDIEESVAFQADIHESRLHPRQNACDAALIDASGERMFVFPLDVNLGHLTVFGDG